MITSHEISVDFIHFYCRLKIYYVFNPERIVTDACDVMHKAFTEVYPEIEILMCWFHVKLNVILM